MSDIVTSGTNVNISISGDSVDVSINAKNVNIATNQNKIVKMVVMLGDSNMDGRALNFGVRLPTEYKGPQSNVYIYNKATTTTADDGQWENIVESVYQVSAGNNLSLQRRAINFDNWGPQMIVGKLLADYYNEDIYLINAAEGGEWVSDYKEGLYSYNRMVNYVTQGYNALIAQGYQVEIMDILWNDGYNAALQADRTADYVADIDGVMSGIHAFINSIRNDPDRNIILNTMPDYPGVTGVEPGDTNKVAIRAAVNGLVGNYVVIPQDFDAVYQDIAHIKEESIIELSTQYFNRMIL